MDAKLRWSGKGDNNTLVWEAKRRFRERKSGVALDGGDWKGAVEEATASVCLLEGQLVKQPRGRTNTLLRGAARTRYFKLYNDKLKYFAQDKKGMEEKGTLSTAKICVVETIKDEVFGKNSFQVMTADTGDGKRPDCLYLTAPSDTEKENWMLELRLLCFSLGNAMNSHYHPNVLGNTWHCCRTLPSIRGCQLAYEYPSKRNFEEEMAGEDEVEALPDNVPSTPSSPTSLDEPEARAERSASLPAVDESPLDLESPVLDDTKRRETYDFGSRTANNPLMSMKSKPAKPKRSPKSPFDPPSDSSETATSPGFASSGTSATEVNGDGPTLIVLDTPAAASILAAAEGNGRGDSLTADDVTTDAPLPESVVQDSAETGTIPADPRPEEEEVDGEAEKPVNGPPLQASPGDSKGFACFDSMSQSNSSSTSAWPQPTAKSESNPFGDDDQFGSLRLPEAQSRMVESPSSPTLTSFPSSDTLKLPAPPKTAAEGGRRISRTDISETAPSEQTSLSTAGVESQLTQSGEASPSRPSSGKPTNDGRKPSATPSQNTADIALDIMMDDPDDESGGASLLTPTPAAQDTSPKIPRSQSTVGSLVPRIFSSKAEKNGKDSKNRLSTTVSSEVFDVVEVGDCHGTPSEGKSQGSLLQPEKDPFKELHQACQHGLLDEVLRRLDAGDNPDEPHKESRQPPIFLAYYHDHIEVIEVLLSHGAQVNMTMNGATMLHIAASSNNAPVVQLLLSHGAQVDFKDWHMRTALHLASEAGRHDAVKLLLESGADVGLPDQEDCTVLHMSAKGGHVSVVKLLLEYGAPAFTKNKADLTPLDLAVKEGHREVTELLRTLLPDTHQAYVSRQAFRAHRKEVNTVAFLPDNRVLSGASENQVCIWDCSDISKAAYRRKLSNTILSSDIHHSQSQSLVAIGSDRVLVLDLTRAGWRVVLLDDPNQEEQLYLVEFTPNGLLATAGVVSGADVQLWDIRSEQTGLEREPLLTITADQDGEGVLHAIKVSPREERPLLAVSIQPGRDRLKPEGNNIVHLFDWTNGCHVRRIDTGFQEFRFDLSMTFSAHGRYLITGSSSGKVSVWAAASGLLVNQFEIQEDSPVSSLAFSGNGHTLAVGSGNGKVDLFNIVTGKPFFLPEQNQKRPALSLAFSKTGDALTTGYDDGTVQIWNVVGGAMQVAAAEVEAFSPFEYTKVIQANGEKAGATRAFLRLEYEKLDKEKTGSLEQEQMQEYFQVYMNAELTASMFTDLQQNFLTDADLGGLTVEGFSDMAFSHLCQDPEVMWTIWLERGFPQTI